MRRLILMRHSEAEPAGAGASDHGRLLTARGRQDGSEAGKRLAALGRPDLVLLSDSGRTRETLACLLRELGAATPRRISGGLYGADSDRILAEVRATADAVRTLLVIGHNPGIADLVGRLAGRVGAADAGFPTSCFAVIALDAAWEAVGEAGRLEHVWRPSDPTAPCRDGGASARAGEGAA